MLPFEAPQTPKQSTHNSHNFVLIQTIKQTIDVVINVLLKEDILAIDCEGITLSKEGQLTLIQIGLRDKRVFLFDILKGGSLMFIGLSPSKPGLKSVLESKRIWKILHDCRSDWDSLLYQYSIRWYNFIDTQEAYFIYMLFYNQELSLPISLLNFLKVISGEKLNQKVKMKHTMHEDPTMWGKRPISNDMITYAAEDVMFLVVAWLKLKDKLNEYLIEIIKVLSILKVVDKEMFGEFSEYLTKIFFDNYELFLKEKVSFQFLIVLDYVHGFFEMKNQECAGSGKEGDTIKDLIDKEWDVGAERKSCDNNSAKSIVKSGLDYKRKQREVFLNEMMERYRKNKKGKKNGKNGNKRNGVATWAEGNQIRESAKQGTATSAPRKDDAMDEKNGSGYGNECELQCNECGDETCTNVSVKESLNEYETPCKMKDACNKGDADAETHGNHKDTNSNSNSNNCNSNNNVSNVNGKTVTEFDKKEKFCKKKKNYNNYNNNNNPNNINNSNNQNNTNKTQSKCVETHDNKTNFYYNTNNSQNAYYKKQFYNSVTTSNNTQKGGYNNPHASKANDSYYYHTRGSGNYNTYYSGNKSNYWSRPSYNSYYKKKKCSNYKQAKQHQNLGQERVDFGSTPRDDQGIANKGHEIPFSSLHVNNKTRELKDDFYLHRAEIAERELLVETKGEKLN